MNEIQTARYNEIVQETIKFRGIILHQMAHLEKVLDNYIIFHLVNKKDDLKVSLMQLLIFGDNRIAMENKRQIFHEIAQNFDKKWYTSYKSIRTFKKESKTIEMNKDLVYCIENRNMFAHCIPDTPPEALNSKNTFGFIKFKDTATKPNFTKHSLNELEKTIVRLMDYLLKRNGV